jgi:hypothetical protein
MSESSAHHVPPREDETEADRRADEGVDHHESTPDDAVDAEAEQEADEAP